MSAQTNAFWREVLDYLPGFLLLFRIDANERAHLIFTSQGVQDHLGFSPEEYVLASEGETAIKDDLEKLVDKIAGLTHENSRNESEVCELSGRSGSPSEFFFDFRLFQTKSQRSTLISVALYSTGVLSASAGNQPGDIAIIPNSVNSDVKSAGKVSIKESLFVAESELMSAVVEQLNVLSARDSHVLVRGEKSVGKRTLAERLAKKSAVLAGKQQVWVLNLQEMAAGKTTNKRVFAGFDESNNSETLFDDIDQDLQLVIVELPLLQKSDQRDLVKIVKKRADKGFKTRIIATSSISLEEMMSSGTLENDFYYKLPFITVPVPPLRERKDDIIAFSRKYLSYVADVLDIEAREFSSRFESGLISSNWPGNFEELSTVLRTHLISPADQLHVQPETTLTSLGQKDRLSDANATSLPPDASLASFADGVITFDEMSRRYLTSVLEKTGGKIYGKDGAAKLLGMKPTTLQSKLKKLNIR